MPTLSRTLVASVPPLLILALCILAGCSAKEGGSEASLTFNKPVSASASTAAGAAAPKLNATAKMPVAMPRKIIYNATVELLTEDLSVAAKKLAEQVQVSNGYVAETNISGTPGTVRTGTWKVRVPVERFDAFMAVLGSIGETQNSSVTSEDVSEEFYDLDARIKNKRVEEARLLEHLQKSTGKLTDILAVEQEVSRVREEIERMEGRQRFLSNRTDLTTVTITIREVKTFVAHRPPTLWTQMARTFGGSLSALGDFARGIVLVLVGLAPWLAVTLGITYPIWRVTRRRKTPRKTVHPLTKGDS